MAEKNTDQEFVEHIVKSLVNYPDDVAVERKIDEMGVLLTLKVNPADMALVIGRNGSTARAIRTLVWIIGLRNHARVNFRIEEPEGSSHFRNSRSTMKRNEMDPERSREGSQRASASYGMESVVDELKASE